jgi:hypothetical protein
MMNNQECCSGKLSDGSHAGEEVLYLLVAGDVTRTQIGAEQYSRGQNTFISRKAAKNAKKYI